MAYTVTNGAIAEVTFKGTLFGETILSILHYRLGGAPSAEDGREIADVLNTLVNGAIGSGDLLDVYTFPLATAYLTDQVIIQWIYPTRYARIVYTPAIGGGQFDGPSAPSNLAAVITKKGDLATRHSIGTLHLAGVPIEVIDTNLLADTYLDTKLGPLTEDLDDVLESSPTTFTPVLYNRALPSASIEITACEAPSSVRTMRRRGVRQGV